MSQLTFYYISLSPPCRAVEWALKLLKIQPEFKTVSIQDGEHLTESFLKLNPQHTVPVLVDGDFSIWHSQNILLYLLEKYGAGSSLYPKDLEVRTQINQYLFFEASSLFARLKFMVEPVFYYGATSVEETRVEGLKKALELLNDTIDSRSKFLVGDNLTIADLSVAATTTGAFSLLGTQKGAYPKVDAWLERLSEALPEWEAFDKGGQGLGPLFRDQIATNAKKA